MDKWADYCISKVRYNSDHNHIDEVETRLDNGETIGSPQPMKRIDVVDLIHKMKKFITIKKNSEGKWIKGEDVRTVIINGIEYIRTDANNTKSDNLGELPEY